MQQCLLWNRWNQTLFVQWVFDALERLCESLDKRSSNWKGKSMKNSDAFVFVCFDKLWKLQTSDYVLEQLHSKWNSFIAFMQTWWNFNGIKMCFLCPLFAINHGDLCRDADRWSDFGGWGTESEEWNHMKDSFGYEAAAWKVNDLLWSCLGLLIRGKMNTKCLILSLGQGFGEYPVWDVFNHYVASY